MWEKTVWRGGACGSPVGLSMHDGPMETGEYIWIKILGLNLPSLVENYVSFQLKLSNQIKKNETKTK